MKNIEVTEMLNSHRYKHFIEGGRTQCVFSQFQQIQEYIQVHFQMFAERPEGVRCF